MTPNALYFILTPLGFGIFLALGLATTFRHGWKYPFKWYSITMLYIAACSITYMPIFDFLEDAAHNHAAFVLHHILTSLSSPLLMMAFMRLSAVVPRLNFKTVFLLWMPFLLYLLCYLLVPETDFLLYVCYLYILGTTLWWCQLLCRFVKFMGNRPVSDDDSLPLRNENIGWMRNWAIVIALLTIARWSSQTFFPIPVTDWVKPQMMLILLVYLPLFIIYEWRHGSRHFFDSIPQPATSFSSRTTTRRDLVQQRLEARAARSRMQTSTQLPPNALLPDLVAGAALPQSPSDEPTLRLRRDTSAIHASIEQALHQLERDSHFFLDSGYTTTMLAQAIHVSRADLVAYFREQGTTCFDYIDRLRILHAAPLLLRHPQEEVSQVAFNSGFSSLSHFSRTFSDHFHCTPDDYRASHGITPSR